MNCTLNYIPEYLHSKEKPIIENFSVGEQLYYRCKQDECKKPYDKISLYDISHNRNFGQPHKYQKKDVLINILEDDLRQQYENVKIAVLHITELQGNKTYFKELISRNDPNLKASIILKHSPVPCMYPHSVFEISVNKIVVNNANYPQILNKRNVTYKNLRYDIRQELTSILQTNNIDSSEDVEYIEEP